MTEASKTLDYNTGPAVFLWRFQTPPWEIRLWCRSPTPCSPVGRGRFRSPALSLLRRPLDLREMAIQELTGGILGLSLTSHGPTHHVTQPSETIYV